MTFDKAIFLSHAHVDRVLADLLRNTFVLGGVHERHMFYSSGRATGIPSGEDVRPYLQRALQEAGLVIELVSETFLRRPICLMELGGAWALGKPTFPIVVPPLTRQLVVQHIGDVQMGILGEERDLDELFDELHDRLARDVGIQAETTPWNRAIREFKGQLTAKLEAAHAAAEVQTKSVHSSTREQAKASNPESGRSSRDDQVQQLLRRPFLHRQIQDGKRSSEVAAALEELKITLAEFLAEIDYDPRSLDTNLEDVHRFVREIREFAKTWVVDFSARDSVKRVYDRLDDARNAENDKYELYAVDLEGYRNKEKNLDAVIDRRRAYIRTLRDFQEPLSAMLRVLRREPSRYLSGAGPDTERQ